MVQTEFIFYFVYKESPLNLRDKVPTVQTVKEGDFLKRITTLKRRNIS